MVFTTPRMAIVKHEKKSIENRSILEGEVDQISRDTDPKGYTDARGEKKDEVLEVTVINPITKKETAITIDRRGSSDEQLGMILSSPDASKEQKDVAITNYLFERGLESASFLGEMFRTKGAFTKESHQFKSQMRFDYEQFVSMFILFLQDVSRGIRKDLEEGGYTHDEKTFTHIADRFESAADLVSDRVKKITEDRMRDAGFGIYIDKKGKIYSIFDKEFDEKIEEDKQKLEELKKQNEDNPTN